MFQRRTLALALFVTIASTAAHADDSPIVQIRAQLEALAKAGKDVAALRADLDALSPEWDALAAKRTELEAAVHAFQPKIEALVKKIQKVGGGGGDPIADLTRALTDLKGAGKDTAALDADLATLRPEWQAIQDEMKALSALPPESRKGAEGKLHAKVDAFRPKVEDLAHRVQQLAQGAGSPDPDRAH